jgi:uncharacterized protein DUF6152
MKNMRWPIFVLLLVVCSRAFAHHSGSEYDFNHIVEIEGTLVELRWQNPHVQLRVRAPVPGLVQPMIWEIEGSSVSILSRAGADPHRLHVGDTVRVAGEQSKRAPNRMFAHNLLCADGTEFVFHPGGSARWAKTAVAPKSAWFEGGTKDTTGAGLFRVWSSKLDEPEALWLEHYPLTVAAKKKLAAWDPVHDDILRGCEPKGMPTIMEQPYPLQFERDGDDIRLRLEEADTVRTIHMNANLRRESLPKNRLGRSTGRWDGNTLVVTTDGIQWSYIDPAGTPLSPSASLVERFTPTQDGTRLQYSLVITDPVTLTEPVQLKRSWVARPNEVVKPYRCGRP